MYSPGMFTTSQCQNLIGPTNKTKQWIIFFIYKNKTNLDKLFYAYLSFFNAGSHTFLIQDVARYILKRRRLIFFP